jgi:hypothetical protein
MSTRKTTTTTQSGHGTIIPAQSAINFFSGHKTYIRRSSENNTAKKKKPSRIITSDVYGEEIDGMPEPFSAPG